MADQAWEDGFESGENDHAADWYIAMTEVLGLSGDCEIWPMRVAQALAEILTDEQKRQLEAALLAADGDAS